MKRWVFITSLVIVTAVSSLLLDGCKKDRYEGTPLSFIIPQGFPQPVVNFTNNPITEEGFQLGKKLFYDGRLSVDNVHSCASCHQQVGAFTTFEHDRSHGVHNSHTLRNAPALANLAWYPEFMQDGSAKTLEDVYLSHITAHDQMDQTMGNIIEMIQNELQYRRMFRAAYGNELINEQRIFNALTQFVINLVSANSKFDKVQRGATSFTTQEQSGYTIFQSKCAGCHAGNLFTDFSYRNIGLPVDANLNDYGRMRVTNDKNDSLKFRVPSLRNVELTSYYAHDGRFSFIRHVIQHYRFNVVKSPTLDPLLTNGIFLTNQQEDELIAFLRTLSDSSYLNNPRFKE